jgi:hypothetical protein
MSNWYIRVALLSLSLFAILLVLFVQLYSAFLGAPG